MNVDTISDFLAESRDEAPAELQHLFLSFEDLWGTYYHSSPTRNHTDRLQKESYGIS